MSNITIGALTLANSHGYTGSIKLRIWYTGCAGPNFQDSLNNIVMCGNGSSSFYLEVSVSLAGTTLSIPSYVLPSTDNSSQLTVLAHARFYVNNVPREDLFSNWIITATLGASIAYDQLFDFNIIARTAPGSGQAQFLAAVTSLILSLISDSSQGVRTETPAGLVNGVNTVFTLSDSPLPGKLLQFQNKQLQQENVDYTLVGTQLTFAVAPQTGDWLHSAYLVAAPLIGTTTTATEIIETGGPTLLTIGSIPDLTLFQRSGTTVVGISVDMLLNTPVKTHILKTTGTGAPGTVQIANLYPAGNYGQFLWEVWAMPAGFNGPGYLLSAGFGGNHVLLFGLTGGAGPFKLTGNIWNGAVITSFGSDESIELNEWAHLAVGWDGVNIMTYIDGVPVGKTPFTGPFRVSAGAPVENNMYIGGSDHLNSNAHIAQVRGFEVSNPLTVSPFGPSFANNVIPQELIFTRRYAAQTATEATVVLNFLHPSGRLVLDASINSNNGMIRGVTNGVLNADTWPQPYYIQDSTSPFYDPLVAPTPPAVGTPPAAPVNALIFDSFTRPNTLKWPVANSAKLGSTESGSLGPKLWQNLSGGGGTIPCFAVFNQRVVTDQNGPQVAFVAVGLTDLDIRVSRRISPIQFGCGAGTTIAFRVLDNSNFCFVTAFSSAQDGSGGTANIGHRIAGVMTEFASGVALPTTWTVLRVVTKSDGTLECYADATLFYSTPLAQFAGVSGAGIMTSTFGQALGLRWDNFTVFNAP